MSAPNGIPTSPQPGSSGAPVDRAAAVVRLGGDEALFEDFARSVLDEVPGMLAQIRAALSEGRLDEAHRIAHGLKGMLATLEARPAADAARDVERLTQELNSDGAAAAADRLKTELERLAKALAQALEPAQQPPT